MQKHVLSALFICFSAFTVHAQVDDREHYLRKVESYTKLKQISTSCAIAGAGAVVAGGIMISNAEFETHYIPDGSSYTVQTGGPNINSSILTVMLGVTAMVPGTILGLISNRKAKEYNKKLQQLHFGVNYLPQNKGITITYRF